MTKSNSAKTEKHTVRRTMKAFGIIILLYHLTLELLLYLIHDNVDFTLFYCVRLKLDSRFNWGINTFRTSHLDDRFRLVYLPDLLHDNARHSHWIDCITACRNYIIHIDNEDDA